MYINKKVYEYCPSCGFDLSKEIKLVYSDIKNGMNFVVDGMMALCLDDYAMGEYAPAMEYQLIHTGEIIVEEFDRLKFRNIDVLDQKINLAK